MEKQADGAQEVRKGINVVVAVPCMNQVEAFFTYDLAQMMAHTNRHFVREGVIENLGLAMRTATYVHTSRQELAGEALRQDADYILFLDSDMRFPKDTLVRLLQHQEPIVGVNYVKRAWPPAYVAIKTVGDGKGTGALLPTHQESTGLEEAAAIGFGVTLIRRDVFLALPDPREHGPWWWYEWVPETGRQIGEDVYFCRLAKEAGFKTLVDHDLSKEIEHIGQERYTLAHGWAWENHIAQQAIKVEDARDGDSHELLDVGDGSRPDSEPDGSGD
jgi:hypothetical protein